MCYNSGMNNGDLFDDFALEKSAKELFGVSLEIDKVIARNLDVGQSARATLYLSKKKQLYCYIEGPARLLLSDVKKIASRIGIKPEIFSRLKVSRTISMRSDVKNSVMYFQGAKTFMSLI